jgi:hypothetical protein
LTLLFCFALLQRWCSAAALAGALLQRSLVLCAAALAGALLQRSLVLSALLQRLLVLCRTTKREGKQKGGMGNAR